jgi:hypothetical protein
MQKVSFVVDTNVLVGFSLLRGSPLKKGKKRERKGRKATREE